MDKLQTLFKKRLMKPISHNINSNFNQLYFKLIIETWNCEVYTTEILRNSC